MYSGIRSSLHRSQSSPAVSCRWTLRVWLLGVMVAKTCVAHRCVAAHSSACLLLLLLSIATRM
jgi:hypothetical protein